MAQRQEGKEGRLTRAVAIVITIVWVISFLADLFVTRYDPPPSVMPLMLATAGYLFGLEVTKRHKEEPRDAPVRDQEAKP